MKIDKILKDSNYKINQNLFSDEIIQDLENSIFEKETKKGKAYYTKCVIRDKEIQLKPEEVIRQLYLRKLLKEYAYPKDRIKLEYPIYFGREVKKADIVITEKNRPDIPYIIVEVKKPKLKEGKQQLKSYTNATGAPIAVWTNGERIEYFHRKDPNYFENIPDIPKANQSLKDLLKQKFTIEDLKKVDKLTNEKISLKNIILDLEDEVLANAGVDVFEEVFKLIFTKLYDELMSIRDKNRDLEFRNYGETDFELKEKIQKLFDEAKEEWEGIFPKDSKIELSPSHLSICVSSLQDIKIFNTNLDVIDEAFEYLVNKTSKGEKGQYFTPRYVIDMAVKMLNPDEEDYIIDPACGSFGFPLHAVFEVWRKIYKRHNLTEKELLTAEEKHPDAKRYVERKVFGIDFDEKVVRVAKLLNLIAGDGHSNVIKLNSLDYELWEEWIKDEDWQDKYFEGWKKLRRLVKSKGDYSEFNFDIVLTNPPFAGDIKESRIIHKYEISRANKKGKYPLKISRDILFIERALKMLKPGGRMAIVLPQGRLNNATDKYIREFISQHARILAVVGLHQNVFKPHTGTKTSVLFLQKWDDKINPKVEDYSIFFATMEEPSKDNSGEKIFVKYKDFLRWEEEGKIPPLPEEFKKKALENPEEKVLDKYGHLIVKHDLYSVETYFEGVKTPEGIAEAFLEFAKKEGFSFVKKKLSEEGFDEGKYKRLLDKLEAVELKLSDVKKDNPDFRLDSEFFKKEYLEKIKIIEEKPYKKLKTISSILGGKRLPKGESFTNDGVPYIRAEDVKSGFIEYENLLKISY
ncbi:MAG: N-6 DNA methylase, partial [Aquificae bacterium]|nr:N-6 DNA methylase [Aquificota bacterium]